MMAIMKREIRNYLKRPLFWLGVVIVVLGVYVHLDPYLKIHYIRSFMKGRFMKDIFPAAKKNKGHCGKTTSGRI